MWTVSCLIDANSTLVPRDLPQSLEFFHDEVPFYSLIHMNVQAPTPIDIFINLMHIFMYIYLANIMHTNRQRLSFLSNY